MANYRMIRAQLIRAESALAAKQRQLSSILKSYQDRKFRLIQDNLKRSFYIEYAKASNSSAEFLIAKSNIKEFHKLLALTINGKISSYARYFVDCLFEPSRLKKRSWLFGLSKISMEKELIISGDEHEKLSDLEQILQKSVAAHTKPEANELNPLFNSSHFLDNRYEITAAFVAEALNHPWKCASAVNQLQAREFTYQLTEADIKSLGKAGGPEHANYTKT